MLVDLLDKERCEDLASRLQDLMSVLKFSRPA